jgi:hypothetical protein
VNQTDKEIARCQYVRQRVAPIPPGRNTVPIYNLVVSKENTSINVPSSVEFNIFQTVNLRIILVGNQFEGQYIL